LVRFYKLETAKNRTEPKPKKTGKNRVKTEKPSQTGLNRFLSKKPNRTETCRFKPVSVSVFFFLKSVWLLSFYKKQTEQKINTPAS
jgi:hypothetical protein